MKTYQQGFLYIIPTITNLVFVSIAIVVVRLYWFRRHLARVVSAHCRLDEEAHPRKELAAEHANEERPAIELNCSSPGPEHTTGVTTANDEGGQVSVDTTRHTTITFDKRADNPDLLRRRIDDGKALHIPGPRQRDAGYPLVEVNTTSRGERNSGEAESTRPVLQRTFSTLSNTSGLSRRSRFSSSQPRLMAARSIERTATSILALGHTQPPRNRRLSRGMAERKSLELPRLSRHVTVGRNSNFHNLTSTDREILGGIEYRALKLLLKFILCYFFGLHIFGILCLVPWIHNAPSKYTDWLEECGIGRTWWAFYSAMTMANNLGFTLTPDSMATFKDATWPMLCMTFMAFAGHTFYPVFLRLALWTALKVSGDYVTKESLQFLLNHPRRCYTLLFPSKPTWILAGILLVLNLIDVLLIIVLDLHNPAVNDLPMGPRILSALFQAASARHTGTSTLSLGSVNPAVQLSLLVMMYIAIFPIAISIRASNTYEEKSLGLYEKRQQDLDESNSRSYVMSHIRNQLSFDLWYVFLGAILICIAEAGKIMDEDDTAFVVFPIIFECVSA